VAAGGTDIGGFHAAAQDRVDLVGLARAGRSDDDHEQLLGSRRSGRVGMYGVECLSLQYQARQRRKRNRMNNGGRWDARRLICHRLTGIHPRRVSKTRESQECGHESTRSNSREPSRQQVTIRPAAGDCRQLGCPWCQCPAPSQCRCRREPLIARCADAGSPRRKDGVRRRVRWWAWRALRPHEMAYPGEVATASTCRFGGPGGQGWRVRYSRPWPASR
jgi:hypothetical protein